MVGGYMAKGKVYGMAENKCLVEVNSKEDMDDRIPETIKIRVSEIQPASPPSGELILWIKKE